MSNNIHRMCIYKSTIILIKNLKMNKFLDLDSIFSKSSISSIRNVLRKKKKKFLKWCEFICLE